MKVDSYLSYKPKYNSELKVEIKEGEISFQGLCLASEGTIVPLIITPGRKHDLDKALVLLDGKVIDKTIVNDKIQVFIDLSLNPEELSVVWEDGTRGDITFRSLLEFNKGDVYREEGTIYVDWGYKVEEDSTDTSLCLSPMPPQGFDKYLRIIKIQGTEYTVLYKGAVDVLAIYLPIKLNRQKGEYENCTINLEWSSKNQVCIEKIQTRFRKLSTNYEFIGLPKISVDGIDIRQIDTDQVTYIESDTKVNSLYLNLEFLQKVKVKVMRYNLTGVDTLLLGKVTDTKYCLQLPRPNGVGFQRQWIELKYRLNGAEKYHVIDLTDLYNENDV